MIPQRIQNFFTGAEPVPDSDQQTGAQPASEQQTVDQMVGDNKNANAITDEIFYQRHPDLKGQQLSKDSPLSNEWKQIKSEVVEPRMQQAAKAPSTETKTETQTPASGSNSAADTKGWMDMGAGLLRKSLETAVDTGRSARDTAQRGFDGAVDAGKNLYDNIAGKDIPVAPGTPAAPLDPAGPNAARAQELAKVDTSKLTESQKYDHYKDLITAGGGKFNDEPGARNIVSVRDPDVVGANNGQGQYNDNMAVVWTDKDGTRHVEQFKGNTEPNKYWSERQSLDVDKDGTRDAGRLLEGYYEFKVDKRTVNGKEENALRPTADVEVERDMNHDGLYNDDKTSSAGTSILFHNGKGKNSTGSAGCQTIPSDQWENFWKAASNGTNKENIGYTLVQLDE